jgi:hypothetical protein
MTDATPANPFKLRQKDITVTTPQQLLVKRRRQIMDDETMDRIELGAPEREDSWVRDFVARLAGVIRSKG